jgi:hypothetical protein
VIPQTLPDARVQEPPASIGTRFSWLALENGLHDAWLSSLRRLHLASETPASTVASTTELADPPVTSRFKQALMRWRDHAHAETPTHASRSDALASATTPSGAADATEAPSRFKLADTRVLDEGLTMNDGQVALRARVGARAVEGRSLPAPCVAESSVYCEALKVDADRPVPTLDGGYNALRWYQAVQLGFVTRF